MTTAQTSACRRCGNPTSNPDGVHGGCARAASDEPSPSPTASVVDLASRREPVALTAREQADRYLAIVVGVDHPDTVDLSLSYADPTRPVDDRLRWVQVADDWPADRPAFVEHALSAAPERDVYVCPALRPQGHGRHRGEALRPRVAWADVDREITDDDALALLGKLVGAGAVVVASGSPGARHVYVPLSRPVEVHEQRALNAALVEAFDGDRSKVGDDSLLRLPGTRNHKFDPPTPVELIEPGTGERVDPDELAAMLGRGGLAAVVAAARTRPESGERTADPEDVAAFMERHTDSERPELLESGPVRAFRDQGSRVGDRHPALKVAAPWAARLARAGMCSATSARQALEAEFTNVKPEADADEFDSVWRWAVIEACKESVAECRARVTRPLTALPASGAASATLIEHRDERAPAEAFLDEGFWTSRPVLEHIRTAARARRRSPDAVLAAVLARVASVLPHTTRLDGGLGKASPNVIAVLVARSGGGKSTAMDTAMELVDVPFGLRGNDRYRAVPLGTGEGIAEQFMGMKSVENDDGKRVSRRMQVRHNALFLVDEGEQLFRTADRKGATVMTMLRSMWSGQLLGQANATQETSRIIPAGSYSAAMLLGVQLGKAAPLFDDHAGGTLQRCLFAPALSREAPRVKPEWPGGIALPVLPGGVVEYPESVRARLDHEAHLIDTEQMDRAELDAHEPAHLLKISALLAVLDGRSAVTEADWELAEAVWVASRAARGWVRGAVTREVQAAHDAATARHVDRERQVDAARAADAGAREYEQTVTLAAKLARRVDREAGEPVLRRTLRDQADGDRRALVPGAIEHAAERGWITEPAPGRFVLGERNGEIPGPARAG